MTKPLYALPDRDGVILIESEDILDMFRHAERVDVTTIHLPTPWVLLRNTWTYSHVQEGVWRFVRTLAACCGKTSQHRMRALEHDINHAFLNHAPMAAFLYITWMIEEYLAGWRRYSAEECAQFHDMPSTEDGVRRMLLWHIFGSEEDAA